MNNVADIEYNSQAFQDKFVLNVLNFKTNGRFIELGANDPFNISNTILLEKKYNWQGIMVEYDSKFKESYKQHRSSSYHVFQDATTVDYKGILEQLNYPSNIDYLQIDLEPGNGSTLKSLQLLDRTVFDTYKFASVTFEHDIYNLTDNFVNARIQSREIFQRRGYIRVFSDVNNDGWLDNESNKEKLKNGEIIKTTSYSGKYPFEDWYVHPDLVDMTYIEKLIEKNKKNYVANPICGSTLNFLSIEY
jgi:hypothetical protein